MSRVFTRIPIATPDEEKALKSLEAETFRYEEGDFVYEIEFKRKDGVCYVTRERVVEHPRIRSGRFNNTTGALGYMTAQGPRGGQSHPDACKCQDETTPHKHRSEPPFRCARCKCEAYVPKYPEAQRLPVTSPPPEAQDA